MFFLLVLLSSCVKEESSTFEKRNSNFEIKFDNRFILGTIQSYAEDLDLDSSKSIISINLETNSYDTSLYINCIFGRDFKRMPSYYSIVNGYLVFIYTDVDQFFRNDQIGKEIRALMADRNILMDSSVVINDFPTFKISKCEGKVLKENDVDLIELPCYLKIVVEDGQLKLIRKD